MSRFFRSGDSTPSSEESESSNDEEEEIDEPTEELSPIGHDARSEQGTNTIERPPTSSNGHHRDALLHALLEERCMKEVMSSFDHMHPSQRPRLSSPEIQAEANAKYRKLCAQLAPLNLISIGLEGDQHTLLRQRYRDGLDVLSQQDAPSSIQQPLRRLLTEQPNSQIANFGVVGQTNSSNLPALPYHFRRLLTDVNQSDNFGLQQFAPSMLSSWGASSHQTPRPMIESRYYREFEEVEMLGRGGYGIVYHVRNRLDNQMYAVKKVPLSASRLQRIQVRGQSEVDDLLRELRTLARLDHPNIVRYYAGWIEWVDDLNSRSSDSEDDAILGAHEDSQPASFRRIVTESSEELEIAFEDNTSRSRHVSTVNPASSYQNSNGSTSIQSVAGGARFSEAALALHMQMSLHPMSLADYLSSPSMTESDSDAAPRLSHCFHVEPSINIVLAILDGIEYLHSEGIIHRDIKPANIFLGVMKNPRSTRGSVDLLLCQDCRKQNKANPTRLEVRIGDFGLVALAEQETESPQDSEAVGTVIYQPSSVGTTGPALDIYALGVIAFELLQKFDTRMERIHCIQKLKQGEFPSHFQESTGTSAVEQVKKCINAMLSQESEMISTPDLKKMLSGIQSNS